MRAETISARRYLPWALALLLLTACGSSAPPPALSVGRVSYSEVELGALSPVERDQLALFTAFGDLTATGELPELAAPFVERELHSRLLNRLQIEASLLEGGYNDDELRELYLAEPEYELVVRHLVILSERWREEEDRDLARDRALEALAEYEAGRPFPEVAARYSEEPGADRRGGLLEPGRQGTWVSEFWDAALALEIGEVSGVVESPYGYHLIRLEERQALPFAEVRERVLSRLVDLDHLSTGGDRWAARRSAELDLDEEVTLAWRGGDRPDDAILARWPGGTFTGMDLSRYLSTLTDESLAQIDASPPAEFLAITRALARNSLLVQAASELGLEITAEEEAEVIETEVARLQTLAGELNFKRGSGPTAIKASALRALSPGTQRALLARSKLLEYAAAIRAHYSGELRSS